MLVSSPSLMLHANRHPWAHMYQRGSYSLLPVGLFSVFVSSGWLFSPGLHCKAEIQSSWSTAAYAKYGSVVLVMQLKLLETAFPGSEDIWADSTDPAVGRCWWHLPNILMCLVEEERLLQPTFWHTPTSHLTPLTPERVWVCHLGKARM